MGDRIVEVDPLVDELWHGLVDQHESDLFHSPAWLGVLSDTYGFPVRARIAVDEDGVARAGIVFVEVHDHMDRRVVSLPFSDFCNPLVSTSRQWEMLTEGLIGPDRRFQVKCRQESVAGGDPRLDLAGTVAWHAINTSRDPEVVWTDLAGSARRAIRKAEADGVEVRAADSMADLRTFYDLHLRVRKHKYRLLAQPFSFFENIWKRLIEPGNGQLLLANVGTEVIGGVMYLQWKDTFYYKFNASDAGRLAARPNDLTVWKGINEAHERGLSWLDFGVSDLDQEGLIRYKRKYASREGTVVTLRSAARPSDREVVARTLLNDLTAVLVDEDVNDSTTETAGNILYRYFT